MSILRANICAVSPSAASLPVPCFYQTKRVEELIPIFSKDGKEIRKDKHTRLVKEVIPDSVFHNDGLTCNMFSLSALESAGIPLSVITKPMIGADLDTEGQVTDYIEGIDFEQLKETKTETKTE